jgi:hypothetical protein
MLETVILLQAENTSVINLALRSLAVAWQTLTSPIAFF